jgi:hypothetical protein
MFRYMLNIKAVAHPFLLAANILSLLLSIGSAFGTTSSFLPLQPRTAVTSPDIILQSGTAGNSLIYANSTSAKVSAITPISTLTYYPNSYNIVSGNWYDLSWAYRKRIIINHAQVQANLTAFPILINQISDSDLVNHAQTSGNDILFTSSDGVTKLSHEIEKYVSSTGALVAWVKVPILSSSVDTELYMYYGNPACGSQQDAANVWDSNFIAVWHLKESPTDSTPQFKDSKDGNHGTANNMVAGDQQACKIDGGLNFNGLNAKIPTNTGTSVKGLTQYTVSAWVNTGVLDGSKHVIYEESIGTSALSRVKLLISTTNRFSLDGRDLDTRSYTTWVSPTTVLSTNTWYYVAGVFDSVSQVHHFNIDGVDTTNIVTASTIASTTPFDTPTIGARPSATEFWSGKIDELRISKIARSTAWLTTEYNNENSPSTFYAVSANQEQTPEVWGLVPMSLQTVDTDYFVVRSSSSGTSQFTASTGFLFSSMTINTPTQLNFTVVSEYDTPNVSVTVQVWNYSSSPQAYVTSGEGYLTYISGGTNETRFLLITTNPQFYSSTGNAKIRITGILSTTTQYQQKFNQVKMTYSYVPTSNYNYVLKIVNQDSSAGKIRLNAYSNSNIEQLNNCTIYFSNSVGSNSRQIYIQNGLYLSQTGPWYDLPSSSSETYIEVTLDASNSDVSYLFAYLEILVPNETTCASYILAFVIT